MNARVKISREQNKGGLSPGVKCNNVIGKFVDTKNVGPFSILEVDSRLRGR